jgi:hypothetical protein
MGMTIRDVCPRCQSSKYKNLTAESFSRLYESFSHIYRASDELFQKEL